MYGRYELSLDMVISNLGSKDFKIKTIERSILNDGFYVRNRLDRKEKGSRHKSTCRLNSRERKLVK